MNNTQALSHEDAGLNELDWRITAPNAHRLEIMVGYVRTDEPDKPRLWLMDACDGYGPDEDYLEFTIERSHTREGLSGVTGSAWRATHTNPLPRIGTWRRYREDVAHARGLIEVLGWTLTDEEHALMDALEEYSRQAPARLAE
jgi:hypothetical protein